MKYRGRQAFAWSSSCLTAGGRISTRTVGWVGFINPAHGGKRMLGWWSQLSLQPGAGECGRGWKLLPQEAHALRNAAGAIGNPFRVFRKAPKVFRKPIFAFANAEFVFAITRFAFPKAKTGFAKTGFAFRKA
ncbi:hypothetical protein [Luteimonas cucumeris]|uniref:hypothetical protein n=1 Tax=Luteimonas cucumeris TaxID=985012 RepID=UPI0011A413B0|nr:hypothetical protein [Luteimonas cucumeris]